jgi:hypothetical protein
LYLRQLSFVGKLFADLLLIRVAHHNLETLGAIFRTASKFNAVNTKHFWVANILLLSKRPEAGDVQLQLLDV